MDKNTLHLPVTIGNEKERRSIKYVPKDLLVECHQMLQKFVALVF